MNRVVNYAERTMFIAPPKVVTLVAATATELLPDVVWDKQGEIAYRSVQNTGDKDVYITVGVDGVDGAPGGDATNYHHLLVPLAEFDCSNHRLRVCGYSPDGTTVATKVYYRRDLSA